jgi:hypothetical protein
MLEEVTAGSGMTRNVLSTMRHQGNGGRHRWAIGARLGTVLAAPVKAPHGGEEAGDSRSSSPVACTAIANHVEQSRMGKEQSSVKMGSAAGRSRGELLKPRDASG